MNVKPSCNHPIESVLSSMIDDALKLTADLLFAPPSEWPLAKRFYMNKGYANNDFELLLDGSNNQFHHLEGSFSSEKSTKQTTIEMIDVEQENAR